AIMVSTCARSSASRVPRAYSAASAIWSSLWAISHSPSPNPKVQVLKSKFFLESETLPDIHHAAAKPRLHRIHRRLEFRSQLLAAPAVVIGQQHEFLAIGFETADAFQQPLQLFRHLPPRQRIG